MLTQRLLLREWRESDRPPFAALNGDPRVMQFMPGALSREESDLLADRIQDHFTERGFGPYAAELRTTGEFIGFIGLSVPGFQAKFTPCVEIGWRLAFQHWNRGLATEGARKVLYYGFEALMFNEIFSFTVPSNVRSRRVMENIGMAHDPASNFDHPSLPEGHSLRRHVLYRLSREDWKARECWPVTSR
jgi:RimJ/RimL family protein N-acetyltransferase